MSLNRCALGVHNQVTAFRLAYFSVSIPVLLVRAGTAAVYDH
jgi:hypothetical protein